MSRFGAELEAAKMIINSLVSQQKHIEHYSYKELSEEIHQQQRKVLNQCVHEPTTELTHILATKQYERQDNGDREIRNLRKYLENDKIDRKNFITLKTNRKK